MSDSPAIRIDSKGKYYTKVVSTQRLDVLIRLQSGELVEGTVHIRPEHRLSDELNDEHRFISVTGAKVSQGESLLYEVAYLAVNRASIQWVLPVEAIGQAEEE